jgi:pimeloyl-ACP methyl ester carboxylesterase
LLAGDYTVLTTDPRGINRSPVDDPGQDSTPEMRADDLSRLVAHVDAVLPDTQDERGGVIAGERVHDVNGPVRRSRAGLVFRVSP